MGEMIVYGVKLAAYVIIIGILFTAISTIISLVMTLTMGSVVGDVLKLIGIFLPWNGSAMVVFQTGLSAVVTFAIAYKIYHIHHNFISST